MKLNLWGDHLKTMETSMGKVLTSFTVINRADQIRAEDETISADQVRSITLKNVLVDTGATTLCLPAATIAESAIY